MREHVLHRMDALGCAPALRQLVERLPEDVSVVVKAGRADWLPLAAADGCVAGVYMDVRHLLLLLTPQDARDVADATGCRLVRTNRSTGYLLVRAEDAADATRVGALIPAMERALRRSATRSGSETSEDLAVVRGRRAQRACPETFELVPANGICELHGAQC